MKGMIWFILLINPSAAFEYSAWAIKLPRLALPKQVLSSVLVAASMTSMQPLSVSAYNDENFGDTTISAGSINLNPFASAADLDLSRRTVQQRLKATSQSLSDPIPTSSQPPPSPTSPISPIEETLRLIPSWKYYKLIATEYSKRSADFAPGSENLFMPLM